MKQKILIVDDDLNILELLRLYLEKEGFEVISSSRGDEALELFKKNPPVLVLLDIMLPGIDGWQVCRSIRQLSAIPIIMLSAKNEVFDKVLGLELGADDYLTKPFDPKELIARVKAVLRRGSSSNEDKETLSFPGLTISMDKYEVTYMSKQIEMPPKEIELLFFLAKNHNLVFTREQLLEKVWGFDYFGDSRTVDVHVKRIREKLQGGDKLGWQIKTVWSVGYKFEVN